MKLHTLYHFSHHQPHLSYEDFQRCEYIVFFQNKMLSNRLHALVKELPFQKRILQYLWGYYINGHSSVTLYNNELELLERLDEYIELYLFHHLDEYLPLILSEILYNYAFEPLILSK